MNKETIRFISFILWYLLISGTTFAYTHQDTLRGSNGKHRQWWDVKQYYLYVTFDTTQKSISGMNIMSIQTVPDIMTDSMQIDLQEPMILDSAVYKNEKIPFVREGNVYWLKYDFRSWGIEIEQDITLYYHGKPRAAKMPPWDGGFIWTKDKNDNPWISVACQGLGASSWWPCKDYQADEPDNGITINLYTPYGLTAVSNGRLKDKQSTKDSSATLWVWQVKNPINTYDVAFYIGDYVHWSDTISGEKGTLDIDNYVLSYNEDTAKKHFEVAKKMLHCFEHWMGPYPFYEDGYKLVEAPFLGMEHQSAIAYGNQYKIGYRGEDRSNTGIGTKFDFIIVHESGHEWFGNNITAADIADNWIHEGFTTYTEALFVECLLGREKAYEYTRGQWKNIMNNRPIIGDYGVNDSGPADKYDKGAALVHMIRTLIGDDEQFRAVLRELNATYRHSFINTTQVELLISDKTGLKLKPLFEQYLYTADIPVLEWYIEKKSKELFYRFTNTVEGFSLPIRITGGKKDVTVTVTGDWQSTDWKKGGYNVNFSKDFLIKSKP